MLLDCLSYPLDTTTILRKKNSIKRELLASGSFIEKKIAILGGSTTSEIKNILELFLLKNGINPSFYESEYNKFYEDAVFGNETLDGFDPDIVYIHTTNHNVSAYPDFQMNRDTVESMIKNESEKFRLIWDSLSRFNCAVIQNNFDYPHDRSLGNLDCADIHGKTYFLNRMNAEFVKSANEIKYLYINDINYLSAYCGIGKWFNRSLWHLAKYAVSMDCIPELAFNIAKIIGSIFGKTKKCLVLDLDNTCWGGVIGDDGLNGIKIGKETAESEAYTAFQAYVRELKMRGVCLAVCSKNELENAKEGFSHPDSILRFGDFTSFKADWNPKHSNISDIAKEINIGNDSLVFIDDNPAEREIVSSNMRDVSVPNIGENILDFIDHIDKNGYFEPVVLSADDINRNAYYEDNKKRDNESVNFKSYDEFLVSLDMDAEIKPFSNIYLERITQLINKTNQFNLTTKRYTYAEIENIADNNNFLHIYGKLTDKFGDNGLISIIIGEIKDDACYIDLWIMSCRVLKRGMEAAMLDELSAACRNKNIGKIVGTYIPTSKNSMVSDLYKNFGFRLLSEDNGITVWEYDVATHVDMNKFIKVNR